jgi:hypothetical protein
MNGERSGEMDTGGGGLGRLILNHSFTLMGTNPELGRGTGLFEQKRTKETKSAR